jgi:hypothetical protein
MVVTFYDICTTVNSNKNSGPSVLQGITTPEGPSMQTQAHACITFASLFPLLYRCFVIVY